MQDGLGWTPLMIAASLKDAEGDKVIELLLRKGADVTIKSNNGQVRNSHRRMGKKREIYLLPLLTNHRMPCISLVPSPISRRCGLS